MDFFKYHALGNDYIVIPPTEANSTLSPELIMRLCHRHYGLGSDGILFGPLLPNTESCRELEQRAIGSGRCSENSLDYQYGLQIFNPDGSEAEKSGNGLRIFCRYLYDNGLVQADSFHLLTLGGPVSCEVLDNGSSVRVEMGKVDFRADRVPVTGYTGEVLNCPIQVGEEGYNFNAATIGNPHCIIVCDEISQDLVNRIGPPLERHSAFPNRTNVQVMQIKDRHNLQIEIWERGAGYTLASGSSASACAAAARRLGLCDEHVTVHMPGGDLAIDIEADFSIRMEGKVTGVAKGEFLPDVMQIQ
ncbi:MAG: diaminopimelate epimerase [Lentisphaeria bacterium]